MDKLFTTLRQIWKTKSLRDKILFTLAMLVVFRFAAHVTIPGADVDKIRLIMEQASRGQGSSLAVLSLLTGGAMERFSIVLMGLTPYINASIIMQLLGVIVPSLENLKKEGEAGQKKINQYTRLLTVPLAFVQSYGMMMLINRFSPGGAIVDTSDPAVVLPMMLTVTAGTVFLMWIGELINEKGMGNGISILIFAGIVATVPRQIAAAFQAAELPVLLGLIIATLALTIFIVYVSEADRRVPVVYATRKSGAQQKSFLPMKINQAGMIPIIFAVSLVSMPSILAQFFSQARSETLQKIADFSLRYLNPGSPTLWYNIFYAGLIFAFTYFYVSIVFEPKKVAENIQKRGGFIPGYRPGAETEKFLDETSNRLCFWGGVFLALVAVVPLMFQSWISGGANAISLFISGAGMIIVVGVVLDIVRRINSQLVMHDYDKL
ncbi:preprotein translocase subunit SecY [Candidatus Gracilibacteria bacterium]|nr:preprotein translocase subunit SecY [Candidatus Gracilibacteria bacterium]MCF7819112.1 preprotein translocase subunit SecY [Candidatus Gracilibacteria bacterium]